MNDVDRAIRQSLSAEDAELFDRLSLDQSLRQQVLATFEGQLRWMNVAGWIAGFLLFGAGIRDGVVVRACTESRRHAAMGRRVGTRVCRPRAGEGVVLDGNAEERHHARS